MHAVGFFDHNSGQSYAITASEIPKDLIFALRVYHINVYDYDDLSKAEQVKLQLIALLVFKDLD